jgi:hypothetical protein
MALSYLIDTSVLERLADPTVRHVVQRVTEAGEIARPHHRS